MIHLMARPMSKKTQDTRATGDRASRKERIISPRSCEPASEGLAGVELRTLVSEACAAIGFSTGTAALAPGASLPYHFHECSEAVTVLHGSARILVEGRAYRLTPRDCIHLPAQIPHSVENGDPAQELLAHWSFATATPARVLTDRIFPLEERGFGNPSAGDPESVVRFEKDSIYEPSGGALFCDLFASRFGAVGICGGYGRFLPGASLPCHFHDYDESITIVEGAATCLVQGRKYELRELETAFVPKGLVHRFLNLSQSEMAMVWVYAGGEPDRKLVDSGHCSG